MSANRCRNGDPKLQDFVDGLLSPDEERRMREHLAACETCRREERELRRLITRVAELPREIPPPRDLWPGIQDRIERRREPRQAGPRQAGPRQAGPRQAGPPPARHPWPARRWTARQWLLQAAAAAVFMALGAFLARLATPAGGPAVRGSGADLFSPARASAGAPELDEIESEYLRAKEALWLVVYSRQDELSPVAIEMVRRNLLIVDAAIRDLRGALAEDPGNRRLAESLLAEHRRSIHLLQQLTRTQT